jgi:hypothetical protein
MNQIIIIIACVLWLPAFIFAAIFHKHKKVLVTATIIGCLSMFFAIVLASLDAV